MMENEIREDHCSFAKIGTCGQCIANCHRIILFDGKLFDCVGMTGEGIKDIVKRLNKEAKLH